MNRRDFIKTSVVMAAYASMPVSIKAMAKESIPSPKGHADILESAKDGLFVGKTFFIERPIIFSGEEKIHFQRCNFVIHDSLYLSDVDIITFTEKCKNKKFELNNFLSFSHYLGRIHNPIKKEGFIIRVAGESCYSFNAGA